MRNFVMLMSMAALVACGDKDGDSGSSGGSADAYGWCVDYFNALEGCYTEAGVDPSAAGITLDAYCAAYDGVAGTAELSSFFDCYTDAINAADCSTEEGLNAMSTEAAACVPG